MTNVKFSEAGKPIIIGVVKEPTADDAVRAIAASEAMGANAFDLHVSLLEGDERRPESIAKIVERANSPILAVHYNNAPGPKGSKYHDTSEQRMDELLRAVEYGGCAGIDMQAYTFCTDSRATLVGKDVEKYPFIAKNPKEVVLDDAIIEKQINMIEKVHSAGGEVLMSCHMGVFLNTEEVVALALEMEKRGPDIIKMVMPVTSKDDVVNALNSVLRLNEAVKSAKVHLHCSGKLGRITRYVAPYFGSALVFATDYYNEKADREQLLISDFKSFHSQVVFPEA